MLGNGERQSFTDKPMQFCCIIVATGLLLLVVPFPDWQFLKQISRTRNAQAPISIVGASTIDTVSICDEDQRNIADMLGDITRRKITDLSVGGQLIVDSIDLAAVSGRAPAVQDVIVPVAYPYIDDWTTPYFRKLPIYKMMAPEFSVFRAANFTSFWAGLTGQPRRVEGAYRFEGKDYPDYRRLALTIFADGKTKETCAEAPSPDPAFTKSYYWWTYVATQINPSLPALVGDLDRYLSTKSKHLIFVMLPTNLEYIGRLDPSWPAIIRKAQLSLVDALTRQGVAVVDLSDTIPSAEFIQWWAGTVHFNQRGRLRIAKEIAARVRPDVK